MKDRLTEALRVRFEYYNLYNNQEERWHKKYKNHELYELVKYSFKYDFKDIGKMMPKLLKEFEKRL